MDKLGEQGYTGSINERIQASLFDLYGTTNINVGMSKSGGFKKYFEDNFLGAVEYVAQLDGATQSWQLTSTITIPASTDCAIRFKINGSRDNYEGIFRSADNSDWFRLAPSSLSNNFQGSLAGSSIGGVPYSALTVRNGQERSFTLRREAGRFYADIDEQSFTLSLISGQFLIDVLCEFGGGYFSGYISDFEVDIGGVLTNKIPLTSKAQGATQLATVGSVNATMTGYDPSVWVVK